MYGAAAAGRFGAQSGGDGGTQQSNAAATSVARKRRAWTARVEESASTKERAKETLWLWQGSTKLLCLRSGCIGDAAVSAKLLVCELTDASVSGEMEVLLLLECSEW